MSDVVRPAAADGRRPRRSGRDLRQLLLESALVEFAEFGFEGASTRSIAARAHAHQPQINYHFQSKEALWCAAVDHLFTQLVDTIGALAEEVSDAADLADSFADAIRRFVHFAAEHPELHRIMVHESTADSERLRWMVDRHVRPLQVVVTTAWRRLLEAGIAAPIDPLYVHHVIVGSASLLFVNAPEAILLTGVDPTTAGAVQRHADGIVAMLLPRGPASRDGHVHGRVGST
jgi:TetR/AcrR family transcriptional regulator